MMKTVLAILLALGSAEVQPIVRTVGHLHRILLPPAIAKALLTYDSSFQCWSETDYSISLIRFFKFSGSAAPFAAIGDFNGDGLTDVALHGSTRASEVVIVVLSKIREPYQVQQIKRSPKPALRACPPGNQECGLDTFVRMTPRGTHFTGAFAGHPLTLKHDAFQVECWEKSAELYYWKGGKFHTYIKGD